MKIFPIAHKGGIEETKRNAYNSETRNLEYIINFICFLDVAHYKIDVPMEKRNTLCKVS